MPAESSSSIRERLLFMYVHYLASVSCVPPRNGASTDLADKVAIVLERLVRHCDLFGTNIAGEDGDRLWIRTDELLDKFKVPGKVAGPDTYAGRPIEIPPAVLSAFYPDPQKLYFRTTARITVHEEYVAWPGQRFPATRLINERWRRLAQARAGITIADVPFLGVPLSSQLDGKTWLVIRTEKAIINEIRTHVQKRHAVGVADIDWWVFGSEIDRQVRAPKPSDDDRAHAQCHDCLRELCTCPEKEA
jgi:hypothetical protein